MGYIKKIIIEIGNKEYSIAGGATPANDSVGSDEIRDGSVQLEDLSDEARAAMENQFATDEDVKAALGLD